MAKDITPLIEAISQLHHALLIYNINSDTANISISTNDRKLDLYIVDCFQREFNAFSVNAWNNGVFRASWPAILTVGGLQVTVGKESYRYGA